MATQFKIVSFDVGLKTCSVSIEIYDISSLPPTPPVKYLKGGEATPEMRQYVLEVAKKGTIVHMDKKDLGDKKTFFSGHAFKNLYEWCGAMGEHVKDANVLLIEQQMKINNIAVALMYHLQAFFMITYPTLQIVLYPSKNKTRVIGAPLKVDKVGKDGVSKLVKVTKYQRKKWSTLYAQTILTNREDQTWLKYIFETNKAKKDDLSDVIMQALSYICNL